AAVAAAGRTGRVATRPPGGPSWVSARAGRPKPAVTRTKAMTRLRRSARGSDPMMGHLATPGRPGGGPPPVAVPIAWSPAMSSDASTLLGLLADEDRLRTVAALVLGSGPASVSEVASTAGLDLRRAAKAITRPANAGLVDQHGEAYVLPPAPFREAREPLRPTDSPA